MIYSKWSLKRCVFNFFLKLFKLRQCLTSDGKSFQILGAAFEKARSPKHCRSVFLGISSTIWLFERRFLKGLFNFTSSLRYWGARPWMHLYAVSAILYLILCSTGSQWRSLRTGVMWSYFLVFVTIRPAVFCAYCYFLISFFFTPDSKALQKSNFGVIKPCTKISVSESVRYFLIIRRFRIW